MAMTFTTEIKAKAFDLGTLPGIGNHNPLKRKEDSV